MAETMGIARDWAIILLAIEGIVLSLVPLFLYLKSAQGLGKLLPQVRPFLRQVHDGSDRVNDVVRRASRSTSGPFVKVQSAAAAARAFCLALRRRGD